MNESSMLNQARMPARDEEGYVQHPDLDLLLEEPAEDMTVDSDTPIDETKVRAAGFEPAYISMPVDHPASRDYLEFGTCIDWEPDAPEGDGWRLVAVYDTDDGPAAMFVRPLQDVAA